MRFHLLTEARFHCWVAGTLRLQVPQLALELVERRITGRRLSRVRGDRVDTMVPLQPKLSGPLLEPKLGTHPPRVLALQIVLLLTILVVQRGQARVRVHVLVGGASGLQGLVDTDLELVPLVVRFTHVSTFGLEVW